MLRGLVGAGYGQESLAAEFDQRPRFGAEARGVDYGNGVYAAMAPEVAIDFFARVAVGAGHAVIDAAVFQP